MCWCNRLKVVKVFANLAFLSFSFFLSFFLYFFFDLYLKELIVQESIGLILIYLCKIKCPNIFVKINFNFLRGLKQKNKIYLIFYL